MKNKTINRIYVRGGHLKNKMGTSLESCFYIGWYETFYTENIMPCPILRLNINLEYIFALYNKI